MLQPGVVEADVDHAAALPGVNELVIPGLGTDQVWIGKLIVGGVAYESTNDAPGSITVSSHNEGGNHIKGSITAQLASADGSPAKSVSGTFDVTYLEQ